MDYPRADGFSIGLGRPIGKRFGLGIVAFIPRDRLLRVHTFEPSLPRYFMYTTDPNTYYMALGFGFEQLNGFFDWWHQLNGAKTHTNCLQPSERHLTIKSRMTWTFRDVSRVELDIRNDVGTCI